MDTDAESEEQQETFGGRGSVGRVLLIDARDPGRLGTPAQALEAACAAVRYELRTGASAASLTSVCLYNTCGGVRGVVEIFPLTAPSLSDYQKLLAAEARSNGAADESELADALWHCGRAFAANKRALSERTVMLLARFDDPPPQPQRRPALKRAIDLSNLGITLHLVNISKEPYTPDLFYRELLQASTNGREINLPAPVWSIKDIEGLLRRRSHRLAAYAHLRLRLGDGPGIAVAIYNLTSKRTFSKKVQLSKDRNEIISSNITTVKVSAQPGPSNNEAMEGRAEVPLLKSELLFYQTYGNERIEFTADERENMSKVFGLPAIRLLGFKPQHVLAKEKWFIESGRFLFPDESAVEGSTRAFRALHRACTERGVIAICMLCSRVGSRPRVVALKPCERPLGLQVDIGFDIITIPYLENLKDIPEPNDDIPIPTPAEVDFMKDMLRQLHFTYTPDKFENPDLQSKYRAIEVLALEEENTEPFVDTTKPGESKFQGLDSEMFENIFGPFGAATKRTKSGGEPAPKRQAQTCDGSIDEELLSSRITIKQVNKYTVNDLKNILKWKNPAGMKALTGLKKDELVEMVYTYCS